MQGGEPQRRMGQIGGCAGDETGLLRQFRLAAGANKVDAACVFMHAHEQKAQLGHIITSLLGRRCAGEKLAKTGAGKGHRGHGLIARVVELIVESPMNVGGKNSLHAMLSHQIDQPAPRRFR